MKRTGNPTLDAAVDSAVGSANRVVGHYLEFDWNRNGLFDHSYSDLTKIMKSARGDRHITGDLPDQLRVVEGAASAEMQLVLSGRREDDEPNAITIFDPYTPVSPLADVVVWLAPVRYWRSIVTSEGTHRDVMFTGYIRDFSISRASGAVTITCSDILDCMKAPVRLPHFAITGLDQSHDYNHPLPGAIRPFLTTWVAEEALRQMGRPVMPPPRADCVSFVTCSGSMLPSIGSVSNMYALGTLVHNLPAVSERADCWIEAPFGLAPNPVPDSPNTEDARSSSMSPVATVVPRDGTADGPMNIGAGLWVKMSSNPADLDSGETVFYIEDHKSLSYADDPYTNSGKAVLNISSGGTITAEVTESARRASPRTYTWTTSAALSDGWHYFNCVFLFRNNSITTELRIDGSVTSFPQTSGPTTAGFRYATAATLTQNGGPLADGRTNVVETSTWIPFHQVQWYASSSAAYDNAQMTTPTRWNGESYAVVSRMLGELSWLPNVEESEGWELLKTLCAGEYAALMTDENGTIFVKPRSEIRAAGLDIENATDFSDDQLTDLVLTPTWDAKRNAITVPYKNRYQVQSFIWKNPDAKLFYATSTTPGVDDGGGIDVALDDVIAINQLMILGDVVPPSGGEIALDNGVGVVSACESVDPYTGVLSGFDVDIDSASDPREMTLHYHLTVAGDPLYIGSYEGGNQPSLYVSGLRYSDSVEATKTVSDSADIAVYGRRGLQVSSSDWVQTPDTATNIANAVLADAVLPAPMVSDIETPADQRRQLLDVVNVLNEGGPSGSFYAQVVGYAFDDSASDGGFITGGSDKLVLKVLTEPGLAIWDDPDSGWDVGEWAPTGTG